MLPGMAGRLAGACCTVCKHSAQANSALQVQSCISMHTGMKPTCRTCSMGCLPAAAPPPALTAGPPAAAASAPAAAADWLHVRPGPLAAAAGKAVAAVVVQAPHLQRQHQRFVLVGTVRAGPHTQTKTWRTKCC
jgi:hypothetical protein